MLSSTSPFLKSLLFLISLSGPIYRYKRNIGTLIFEANKDEINRNFWMPISRIHKAIYRHAFLNTYWLAIQTNLVLASYACINALYAFEITAKNKTNMLALLPPWCYGARPRSRLMKWH
jgi:hypothetical protein